MADGTGGISRARAAASYAGGECVDEEARARAKAGSSEAARKRADAEAESRASRFYSSGDACSQRAGNDAGSCGRGSGAFGQSVDFSNRAEVERLLARLSVLDALPSTSPAEHASLKALAPHLHAAKARFAAEDQAQAAHAGKAQKHAAAESARIASVVHAHGRPDTLEEVGAELLRLRSLTPPSTDTALKSAIAARTTELTNQWCAKARAAGMAPPPSGFNPYAASDRDLQSAFLWMTVAGVVPLDAASHDGGLELREDTLEAVALRTPGLGEQLIESYADDPATQRVLLERELHRLGQPMCRETDTNEQLIVRRAQLLRQQHEAVNAPNPQQRVIGLDGLQSTLATAVDYEIEQRIIAMNPGTTTGALAATAFRNGSVEDMRAAGTLGNAVEALAGSVAGFDPTKLGERLPSGLRGRRRAPPPGPGLGRRTRIASGTRRVPTRSGTPAEGRAAPGEHATAGTALTGSRAAAATTATSATTAWRTPVALDDKHILNGEVKRTPGGVPRAVGFHHQAPGTEAGARIVPGTQAKPNKLGVYSGTVEIKDPRTGEWIRKNSESTFFPKHWTRSQVRTAILEAFANRSDIGNGRWQATLPSGMTITGFVDDTGRITSAYPEMDRE